MPGSAWSLAVFGSGGPAAGGPASTRCAGFLLECWRWRRFGGLRAFSGVAHPPSGRVGVCAWVLSLCSLSGGGGTPVGFSSGPGWCQVAGSFPALSLGVRPVGPLSLLAATGPRVEGLGSGVPGAVVGVVGVQRPPPRGWLCGGWCRRRLSWWFPCGCCSSGLLALALLYERGRPWLVVAAVLGVSVAGWG